MHPRSLLAVLLLGAAAPAYAQPVDSQPSGPPPAVAPLAPAAPPQSLPSGPPMEFPSHLDSSLATGIVDLSLGATLVGLGALLTDKPERGSFLGAGLGTLAVGVPMLVVGTQRVKYPRNSEPVYALGTALASMGGTLSGLGIGLGIGQRQRGEDYLGDPFREPNYDAAIGWASAARSLASPVRAS